MSFSQRVSISGHRVFTPATELRLPWIVDYLDVTEKMEACGFQSLYHNSGAFGFGENVQTHARGWITFPDDSLRPEARTLARRPEPPEVETLAALAIEAWQSIAPGRIWVMPKSHWSYELEFGARDWLPALLEHAGVDGGLLSGRTNAAAVEFSLEESGSVQVLLRGLLLMLLGSDFMLAWPGKPLLCTVHHHKQLWWVSSDRSLIDRLDRIVPAGRG